MPPDPLRKLLAFDPSGTYYGARTISLVATTQYS